MPAVCREIEELDHAEEGDGDWRESESPRARVTTEFKTSEDEAEPVFGSGAREPGKVLNPMGGDAGGHLDAGQTALGLGRRDLAELARQRGLVDGWLPHRAGREPSDGLFVRRDLGRGGEDGAGAEDEIELLASRVMPGKGRPGGVVDVAGRRDRQDVDVELHGGVGAQRWRSLRSG